MSLTTAIQNAEYERNEMIKQLLFMADTEYRDWMPPDLVEMVDFIKARGEIKPSTVFSHM